MKLKKLIWTLNIFLILLSSIYALDLSTSDYESNLTTITSGGSTNLTSSTKENLYININSLSGQSNSTNYNASIGFTYLIPEEEETAEAEAAVTTTAETKSGRTSRAPLIQPKFFRLLLKQGDTLQRTLRIKNTLDETLTFTLTPRNIEKFILIDFPQFTLQPREEKIVTLTFFVSETQFPEIYSGFVNIQTQFSLTKIPTILEVQKKKALFDIQVTLPEENKYLYKNEKAIANISLHNLGDLKPIDVTLYYALKDLDGNVLNFKTETLAINEEKTLIRELDLPPEIEYKDYIFYTKIKYGTEIATSADLFHVVKTKPPKPEPEEIKEPIPLPLPKIILFVILLALLITLPYLGYKFRDKLIIKNIPYIERPLYDYIKKTKKLKMNKEEIKKELLKHKWPKKLIDKYL